MIVCRAAAAGARSDLIIVPLQPPVNLFFRLCGGGFLSGRWFLYIFRALWLYSACAAGYTVQQTEK